MFTVLITGCGGYIGSKLTAKILSNEMANIRVVGVDKLDYGPVGMMSFVHNPRFELHKIDIRNTPEMKRLVQSVDCVIHLAAKVGAPLCTSIGPMETKTINAEATKALVQMLSPNQRILYPNTNSGYGTTTGEQFVTERDELNPISTYGITKVDGEKAVLSHPNSVSLRLATVFGCSPRMRTDLMVNDFVKTLYFEKKIKVYQSHYKRNLVGIDDVCEIFTSWMGANHTGVYNFGAPELNMTKLNLAYIISEELGLDASVVSNSDGEDIDKRNYCVSNEKVLSTGFVFRHKLITGIRELTKLYQSVGDGELNKMNNLS